MPALSIIIVHYNTPVILEQCLHSIYTQHSTIDLEIIIVDNYPANDYRERIIQKFPRVKWMQLTYNAGFARANNEGIKTSMAETVLLLNSDTIIENNAIENCYNKFARDNYVACGVQLLNADKTPQISGNYAMTGGLNYLLPLPYLGPLVKWVGTLAKVSRPNVPDSSDVVEVDWINGAFLMVKKEVIAKAGLMDEDFFLYAEEAEWCSRLKKSGRLCIYGQFKVIHLQGVTSNETFQSTGQGYYNLYDRKGLQIMLSNLVRIRKQFGVAWYLFHMLLYTLLVPFFFIFSFTENLFRLRNPFRDFARAGRFAGNVGRLWRYVFTIISNKTYFYKVL